MFAMEFQSIMIMLDHVLGNQNTAIGNDSLLGNRHGRTKYSFAEIFNSITS